MRRVGLPVTDAGTPVPTVPLAEEALDAEWMEHEGDLAAAAIRRRDGLTALRTRLLWYGLAVVSASVGAAVLVTGSRAMHASYPFVAVFAGMVVVLGGVGPVMVGGIGALLLAIAVPPFGTAIIYESGDWARVASTVVMVLSLAVFSELLLRSRLRTLDRERRLGEAMGRTRRLYEQQRVSVQAIQARDERLEQITAALSGVVYQYSVDAQGRERFLYVSRGSTRQFGVDPDDLMADPGLVWRLVHPDDRASVREHVGRSFLMLTPWVQDFRIGVAHRGDGWVWVSVSAIPQRGAEPGSVIWHGIMSDATERRRVEEELRQSQRIESVGRLAGGIAHDFNNVLTAILGEASLLEFDTEPDGEVAIAAQQIRRAAESGAALSRQLLGFARRQTMMPSVLRVDQLVSRSVPLMTRMLREQVSLTLDVQDGDRCVRVDPNLFDQVLMNVAANASDAMPTGGTFSLSVCLIASERAREPAVVQFRLRDTGTGMPTTVRERAFEPFFTTKEVGKGTGLGLATSHGIIVQAGGTMLIESTEGQGTTILVSLPVVNEPADAAPVVAAAAPIRGHETVLVVDDDPHVRRVTAATLTRFGYQVLEADGGEQALAVAMARRDAAAPDTPGSDGATPPSDVVDLLVTDVVMPVMGGAALAQEMRARGLTRRVLFVSGYPDGTITQHGVVPHGVELLGKPFALAELGRRVRQLLDQEPTV